MSNKKFQIVEELYNNILENNTYQELDLPCEYNDLTTENWLCNFEQDSKWSIDPVYKLEKHILFEKKRIAVYIVYLDSESLDCREEFFITY